MSVALSLAQHHLPVLDLFWASFFAGVQLTSLLLISAGLVWLKYDDDDVGLHVLGCRVDILGYNNPRRSV